MHPNPNTAEPETDFDEAFERAIISVVHRMSAHLFGERTFPKVEGYADPARAFRPISAAALQTSEYFIRAAGLPEPIAVTATALLTQIPAGEMEKYWIKPEALDHLERTGMHDNTKYVAFPTPDPFLLMLPSGWMTIHGRDAYAIMVAYVPAGDHRPGNLPLIAPYPGEVSSKGQLVALLMVEGEPGTDGCSDAIYGMAIPFAPGYVIAKVLDSEYCHPNDPSILGELRSDQEVNHKVMDIALRLILLRHAHPDVFLMPPPLRRRHKKGKGKKAKIIPEHCDISWVNTDSLPRLPISVSMSLQSPSILLRQHWWSGFFYAIDDKRLFWRLPYKSGPEMV